MNQLCCKGIVLREMQYGEDSKLLTVLSDTNGRITVCARGAKKPGNRFLAVSQLFCYSEMTLNRGKNMYNLSHADLLEPFYNLRDNLEVLSAAGDISLLTLRFIQEELEDAESLRLLLHTFYHLNQGKKDPVLLRAIFRLRFLCIQGYEPDLRLLDTDICELQEGTLAAMRHICGVPFGKLFQFGVSGEILKELDRESARRMEVEII